MFNFLSCPERAFFYVIGESSHLKKTVKKGQFCRVVFHFPLDYWANLLNTWEQNDVALKEIIDISSFWMWHCGKYLFIFPFFNVRTC